MFEWKFSAIFYLLSSLWIFLEFFDLILRVVLRRTQLSKQKQGLDVSTSVPVKNSALSPAETSQRLCPYALIVSVYNASSELDAFLEQMEPLKSKLWIIDDASTDDTWERLQKAGVQCIRGDHNRNKPGAIQHLLTCLPEEIETVVVLDPDVRIMEQEQGKSDLEQVLLDFQHLGMAAVCPRIAVKQECWLSRLQTFEYWLAFNLGRNILAEHSITSGIAIYRRDALTRVLKEHTLSIYAEDMKNAMILMALGEHVYYDGRLVIETEGKRDLRGWFSQRVGWSYGFIKVYTEHFRDLLKGARYRFIFIYHYIIYMCIFALLLHPLKILSLGLLTLSATNGIDNLLSFDLVADVGATSPAYFLLAYAKYTGLSLFALLFGVGRKDRLRLLPSALIYFFYSIVHILPVTVGYLNWNTLRFLGRRIYRDHYESEDIARTDLVIQE